MSMRPVLLSTLLSVLCLTVAPAYAQQALGPWVQTPAVVGSEPYFEYVSCYGGATSWDLDDDINVYAYFYVDGQLVNYGAGWGPSPTASAGTEVEVLGRDRALRCVVEGPGFLVEATGVFVSECDRGEQRQMRREYFDFGTVEKPDVGCSVFRSGVRSTHFDFDEYNRNGYHSYAWIDNSLMSGLDGIRADFGRAITTSNAYRCPQKNQDVGSQFLQTSKHMFGQAADLIPEGEPLTADWRADISRIARNRGANVLDEGDTVHVQWG